MIVAVHALEGIDNVWNSFNCCSELQFGVAEMLIGSHCFKTWTRYSTTDLDRPLESLENDILFM